MSKKRGRLDIKSKKHFSFKNEYLECFDFLKRSREYIYFIVLLFLIFVVLGFFFQDVVNFIFKNLLGENLNNQVLLYIKNLLLQTEGMSGKELIGFIFLNNLQSSVLGIVLGLFFGIFPIIATIINGYILGFVAILSVKEQGITVLWRIFPHGIFELPAVFISLALGLKIGTYFFVNKNKESFKDLIINSLRVLLLIIFPLLIIAAIIEGALIIFAS
jgi:stage II sporulation protein M